MVRRTVRTLYTSWYVQSSEPCTLHGTYNCQNPVHFMVCTTVRTLHTSWYVQPSEPCTLHGTYCTTVRTLYTLNAWSCVGSLLKPVTFCRSACNHLFPGVLQFLCAELLSVLVFFSFNTNASNAVAGNRFLYGSSVIKIPHVRAVQLAALSHLIWFSTTV